MILRESVLHGIRDGTITLVFRRWRRPSVRSGGTLLTAVGQLHIGDVKRIELSDISTAEARRAGYSSRDDLLADLNARTEGEVYRIQLGPISPDSRLSLRKSGPVGDDLRTLWGDFAGSTRARPSRGPFECSSSSRRTRRFERPISAREPDKSDCRSRSM